MIPRLLGAIGASCAMLSGLFTMMAGYSEITRAGHVDLGWFFIGVGLVGAIYAVYKETRQNESKD